MITEIMLEEHGKILGLLSEAENDFRKFPGFVELLEEHFELEEKVIFSFYFNITHDEISDFFEVLKDHGRIIGLVRSIEKSPKNLGELKELLINHASFENDVLYSRMDSKLDENQKKEIIEKIKQHQLINLSK
jgi:hemerythrin superfamily protein